MLWAIIYPLSAISASLFFRLNISRALIKLSIHKWNLSCPTFQSALCRLMTQHLCARVNYSKNDDVTKWKHFSRYWPFVRGIHRLPVNSPHRDQWLDKRLSKQSRRRLFEAPSRSFWRHCNGWGPVYPSTRPVLERLVLWGPAKIYYIRLTIF